ncbi:hypothetical protein [Pseudomonas fluorescens]|uniref:hypothetical protein n=1 Tax=Pseudomonas fluorescens TaxID=294 RepID=UPI003D1C4934
MFDVKDLMELEAAVLSGVTVGVGSQVLIFGTGATVLIQCPFECEGQDGVKLGHGEDVSTAAILFEFLNQQVKHAFLEEEEVLVLKFEGLKCLKIVPERNGLESYVLTTRFGICPVAIS